jgi:hypothetical protein
MFLSTNIALVIWSFEVLVNEDLCRLCVNRKVSVFLTDDVTATEIESFSAYK